MVRSSTATLALGILVSTAAAISTTRASGFTSNDNSLLFALNIPQDDDSNELYFTLSGTDSSWIAVGLGSDRMKDSLMLMAYADSSGKNVTLSPRLSYGNVEPSYTSNVSITILPGTVVAGGKLTVNAKCGNCRSWQGGSIDPKNTAASFTYAQGPGDWIRSNSPSESIKRHSSYGVFNMDLTKALGTAAIPQSITADTAGTVQTVDKGDRDYTSAAHACLMVLAFVGLMPAAVIILRILNSPKWHGVAQAFSVTIALVGAGVGIYIGTMFNRTKKFNSAHQIIGSIVILAMIGQFILGFLHHRIYKKTQGPTKLSPIHIWLGRFVITLGIVNGFIGFPLALNTKYDWALLALVLLVAIVFAPAAFWRYKRNNEKRRKNQAGSNADTGYQSQPWISGGSRSEANLGQGISRSDINLTRMNYPSSYQQPEQQSRQFV